MLRRQKINVLLAMTSLILSGCFAKETTPEDPVQRVDDTHLKISAEALPNIKLTKAEIRDFPETLTLMGKISPTEDRTAVVPARVAGRIDSILVASGESVKKGQVLATLFSPDFAAAREEYLQSVKQEKTTGNKTSDFANLSKLARKKLENMGLSDEDINHLGDSENSSLNLVIRAPRTGAIVTKNAIIGNMANLGDTLFTIADLSKVWFLGDLYPEDLQKVKKDQEIVIEGLPGTKPIYGKVSFISPVVDPTVRSIKLRALMDNADLGLRSDLYVQGSLILKKNQALLVPTSSILRNQEDTFVFKNTASRPVEGNSAGIQVEKVKVAVASEHEGKSAIATGLQAGDEVVSEGALLLDAALTSAGK